MDINVTDEVDCLFQTIMSLELSHLGRNLDTLVQELATQCRQVFSNASHAAARSAVISAGGGAIPPRTDEASVAPPQAICVFVRQRVILKDSEVNNMSIWSKNSHLVCFA